jgi:uncharacterized membrane protein YedE/YeeE
MTILSKLLGLTQRQASSVETSPSNPRWRYRRKLIIGGFFLGVTMIFFGMATFWWDRSVSSEAIIGGVAIVVALLGAYTGFATYDDVKHQNTHEKNDHENYYTEDSDG